MRRRYAFGTVLAFALAICGGANGSASQDTYGQSSAKSNAREIVVTGCVLPSAGSSSTTGTTGTTGTAGMTGAAPSGSSSAARFILSNASISSGGASSPTSTTAGAAGSPAASPTGTSGTMSGTASSANTYTLIGKEKDLEKNVNSRVEIRGTLEPGSGSSSYPSSSTSTGTGAPTTGTTGTTAAPTTGAAGSPTAGASERSANQVLRVSSVKKLDGSCSGSQK